MKHLQRTVNLLMVTTMFVGATKGKFGKMCLLVEASRNDQRSFKLESVVEDDTNRIAVGKPRVWQRWWEHLQCSWEQCSWEHRGLRSISEILIHLCIRKEKQTR